MCLWKRDGDIVFALFLSLWLCCVGRRWGSACSLSRLIYVVWMLTEESILKSSHPKFFSAWFRFCHDQVWEKNYCRIMSSIEDLHWSVSGEISCFWSTDPVPSPPQGPPAKGLQFPPRHQHLAPFRHRRRLLLHPFRCHEQPHRGVAHPLRSGQRRLVR